MPTWDLSATMPRDVAVDGFAWYLNDKDEGDFVFLGTTVAPSYRLTIGDVQHFITVGIAAIVAGREVSFPEWELLTINPSSLKDLPTLPDVANLTAAQDRERMMLAWDRFETFPEDAYVELRIGAVWGSARVIDRVHPAAGSYITGWETVGAVTYLAKLKTPDGRESATAAAAIFTVRDDGNWPVQATTNESSGGYTGTKTDVEVVSSTKLAPKAAGLYSDKTAGYETYTQPYWANVALDGNYETAETDLGVGVVAYERIDVNLGHEMVNAESAYNDPRPPYRPEQDGNGNFITPGTRDAYDKIYYNATQGKLKDGVPLFVEIATDPGGGYGPWARWIPGALYRYRKVKLRLRFALYWPLVYPRVTTFTWKRRRENIKEEAIVEIDGSGTTTYAFTAPFTGIPAVTLAPVEAGASPPLSADITAVSAASVSVKVRDRTGTLQTSGTFHLIAQGV